MRQRLQVRCDFSSKVSDVQQRLARSRREAVRALRRALCRAGEVVLKRAAERMRAWPPRQAPEWLPQPARERLEDQRVEARQRAVGELRVAIQKLVAASDLRQASHTYDRTSRSRDWDYRNSYKTFHSLSRAESYLGSDGTTTRFLTSAWWKRAATLSRTSIARNQQNSADDVSRWSAACPSQPWGTSQRLGEVRAFPCLRIETGGHPFFVQIGRTDLGHPPRRVRTSYFLLPAA